MDNQFDEEEFQRYALGIPGAESGSEIESSWDSNLPYSDSASDRHDQLTHTISVDQLSFNFPRLTLDGTFQPSQDHHAIGIVEPSSQNQTLLVNSPTQ